MNASREDKEFLSRFLSPLLRKFMGRNEIKKANEFVKKDWMIKGHSVDRPHTVIYYVDVTLHNFI
jgi:hypothetical protein